MNFRQRMAWLLVLLYLALSAATIYYVFEISERFNQYALDHISRYSGSQAHEHTGWHMADIPPPLLVLLVVVPYLQVFSVLLACTKPDPRFSLATLWPVRLYVLCVALYRRCFVPDSRKPVNSPTPNGHTLIDT